MVKGGRGSAWGNAVTDTETIRRTFAARPWCAVGAAELEQALAVPSMLTPEEAQLYHWIGRNAEGFGATLDLGAFAGGSAARILSGLERSGRPYQLHAYDRFAIDDRLAPRYAPEAAPYRKGQANLLPVVKARLARWAPHVSFYPGDLTSFAWGEGPIETLLVDVAKTPELNDHVAAEFMPHLVAGRSLVVHQDILGSSTPWIMAQAHALRDCLEPLAMIAPHLMVFLCIRVPGPDDLAAARTTGMTDAALVAAIRAAEVWLAGMVPAGVFQAYEAQIAAHPGERKSWNLKKRKGAAAPGGAPARVRRA